MNNVIRLDDVIGLDAARPRALCSTGANGGARRLDELLTLLGGEGAAPAPEAGPLVGLRQLHAGDMLFHEGAAAEAIHFVRAGTFKVYRTQEDGYEQVLGFAQRAEVLGFGALCEQRHPTSALALEDSSVYSVLVRDLDSLGRQVPAFDPLVHRALSRTLSGRCELAAMMAAVAAEVRLARFLLNLSSRMAGLGQSPRRMLLRMGRRDIASYLGVAHETVSRSFGVLAGHGLIDVEHREVEILDMDGLHEFARNTRRKLDGPAGRGPRGSRSARRSDQAMRAIPA